MVYCNVQSHMHLFYTILTTSYMTGVVLELEQSGSQISVLMGRTCLVGKKE
jgi:hypothetical protein